MKRRPFFRIFIIVVITLALLDVLLFSSLSPHSCSDIFSLPEIISYNVGYYVAQYRILYADFFSSAYLSTSLFVSLVISARRKSASHVVIKSERLLNGPLSLPCNRASPTPRAFNGAKSRALGLPRGNLLKH